MTDAQRIEKVQYLPLPEVGSNPELLSVLDRMTWDSLPGFVIRASILGTTEHSHDSMIAEVQNALNQTEGFSDGPDHTYRDVAGFPLLVVEEKRGLGKLHDDDHEGNIFNVHRTDSGEGDVLMANSGPLFLEERWIVEDEEFYEPIVAQLATGRVDSLLVDPKIYSAHLKAPDTVVMRFANGNKQTQTIHRFDTSSEERTAKSSLIKSIYVPKSLVVIEQQIPVFRLLVAIARQKIIDSIKRQ